MTDDDLMGNLDPLESAAAPTRAAGLQVKFGGEVPDSASLEVGGTWELIGVLVALLLLVLTFRSVVAAGLPIAVALVGLGVGTSGVTLLASLMDVSTSAPTVATMVGLGGGIDYALLLITRHVEALRSGSTSARPRPGRPRPPVARWSSLLRAPADEHQSAAFGGIPRQVPAQPGPADAGLAYDRRELRIAPARAGHQVDQGRSVRVTTDHGPGVARRHRHDRLRPIRRRPAAAEVLAQHGGLELAQLSAGVDAQLVGQPGSHLAEYGQGVGLTPRPGQGEGAYGPEPLAQRMLGGERLEFGHGTGVVAAGQPGHRPQFEGRRPHLVEPGPLGHGGRRVAQLEVGRPAPSGEDRVEIGANLAGLGHYESSRGQAGHRAGCRRTDPPPGGGHRDFEVADVRRSAGYGQGATRPGGDEAPSRSAGRPVRLQRSAQSGHVGLQGPDRAGGRCITPEQVEEHVDATGRPAWRASAASRARCWRGPRSTGPRSSCTSIAPSTSIRTIQMISGLPERGSWPPWTRRSCASTTSTR